jgi:SOS-response transcriptional repressor LexA
VPTEWRATEPRKLPFDPEKESASKVRRVPCYNPLLENIFEWSFESREAAGLPRPVNIFNQKSALMPIHYEVINGNSLNINEDNYKVVVPYSLIRSVERARCVRIQEHPIRDVFLSLGDVLVLYEDPVPEPGKIVLALVDNDVVVRRWELKDRRVIFTALDKNYERIVVPPKNVKFIGKILGVLRFISIDSASHFR